MKSINTLFGFALAAGAMSVLVASNLFSMQQSAANSSGQSSVQSSSTQASMQPSTKRSSDEILQLVLKSVDVFKERVEDVRSITNKCVDHCNRALVLAISANQASIDAYNEVSKTSKEVTAVSAC